MNAELAASMVGRWCRLYTSGLPGDIADRRVEEVEADLHDHLAHERAAGTGEGRLALDLLSRMGRGIPADVAWRDGVLTSHDWAPAEARRRGRRAYRRGIASAVGAALVLFWMIGALGVIGDSGDAADLLFASVFAVGLLGAVSVRFRPAGMAWVLVAMAVVQMAIGVIAIAAGMVPAYNSPFEVLGLSLFFATLFLGSAWLFRRAARHRSRPGGGAVPIS